MPERDEDTGQYQPDYPDDAFLDALDQLGGSALTPEVSEVVGCDQATANRRLRQLEDAGLVERRQPQQTILWSLGDT